jgi:hypothetical protein
MRAVTVESNGRLEKTAVYVGGEQLAGIRELLIHLDEDGTFDAYLEYEGSDGVVRNKEVFGEYLEGLRTRPPAFSEEEARSLRRLTIESDGTIGNTIVAVDDEVLDGLIRLFVHLKGRGAGAAPSGLARFFGSKEPAPAANAFRAEATFRYEDGSERTEEVF